MQPRELHLIDDDMVMAVLNGDETRIALLQQERLMRETLAINGRIQDLDIF